MTTTRRYLVSTILLALIIAIAVRAQPGQRGNGRGRGFQAGQDERGPGMGSMHRAGRGPGGPGGSGDGPGMGVMRLFRQLDLTEEQREVVRAIMDAGKEAAQAAHEAIQTARQSLHEAVIEEADDATIRAIAATMTQAVGDQAIKQVAVLKEIKNVLTDAQKNELATLISQGPPQGRGPGRGRGRGRMQGPRPGGPERDE